VEIGTIVIRHGSGRAVVEDEEMKRFPELFSFTLAAARNMKAEGSQQQAVKLACVCFGRGRECEHRGLRNLALVSAARAKA
jgi:hypothetical protein